MSLWAFVCSVHLCYSVRNKTHPLDKIRLMQVAGEFFLSRRVFFSLTERTEFTEVFGAHFEPTESLRHTEFTEASPPAPLRMERGVVCEVTPTGLLKNGEKTLNAWMTYRGISVITPLSIRRGAGGEASVAVRFCDIGWLNVSVGLCVFCSSVFSVRKNMSFSICHYVIMSLCLKNHTCLPLSLCHYV